jgi:hypothetical protein
MSPSGRPPAMEAKSGAWLERTERGQIKLHKVELLEHSCGWWVLEWPDLAAETVATHLKDCANV